MFSLIGEQTAPNLFLHLHFEPDIHCLLYSEKTERQSYDLAEALRMWAEQTRKDIPEIPRILLDHENDYRYVRDVVTENISKLACDSKVILNLTSGTKPMNIGMWEAKKTIPRTTVVYLDGTQVRYMDATSKTEPLIQEPSIRVFVRGYGYTIKETTPLDSSDLHLLVKISEVVASSLDIRYHLADGIIPEKLLSEELVYDLIRACFVSKCDTGLSLCKEYVFKNKGLETLRNFWGGEWLSLFVWKIVREILVDKEIFVGTKLINVSGKKGENEVDVMFFKDWKLYCVECKVSKQIGKNEPFYKIKQVTKDLGGIFAVPVLITTKKSVKAYRDETVKHAVLYEDVVRFTKEVKKIVSGGDQK
ncbi:MAG: DUF1887 family CARF protein [candidate division WOR-3 bacterium]